MQFVRCKNPFDVPVFGIDVPRQQIFVRWPCTAGYDAGLPVNKLFRFGDWSRLIEDTAHPVETGIAGNGSIGITDSGQ